MLVADLRRKGRTRLDAQVLEGEAVHGSEPDLGLLTFLGVQHHLSRDSARLSHVIWDFSSL